MNSSLKLCCCHSSTFVCTFCWVVQVLVRRVYAPLGATGTGPPSPKDRSHTCFFWQLCIPHENQCFQPTTIHMITINLFNDPNYRQLVSFTMVPQNNFKGCFQRQRTKVKIYLSPPKKSESSKIAESLKFATNNHTISYFGHFFCQLSLEPV